MQKEDGHPATQGFHRFPRPAWCSTAALCEGFACGDFDVSGCGADYLTFVSNERQYHGSAFCLVAVDAVVIDDAADGNEANPGLV